MGPTGVAAIGRARLVTISAAAVLVLAGLALHGSGSTGGATFRDLAYGPAPTHHVKLVGVVVAQIKTSGGGATISIRKGEKKVGTWHLGAPNCAGIGANVVCDEYGKGTMKIGRLKGKVSIGCHFASKSNSGTITQGVKTDELFKPCPSEKPKARTKFKLGY